MMTESLRKTLDYFLNPEHAWMFGNDVHRAMTEFSGSTGPLTEESLEHFIDWFLFDFAFRIGETPLAYLCRTNPLKFLDNEITELKNILTNARFGYFEVIALGVDRMTFADTENGERFEIADAIAAPDALIGDVFLCRIAPVEGMWHVINSSALALRPTDRDWERIKSKPVRDSREAYHEVVQPGIELPDISALNLENGRALISGGLPGWSPDEDDDCAICRLMRKARTENRKPTHAELTRAFREANKRKRK